VVQLGAAIHTLTGRWTSGASGMASAAVLTF